MHMRQLISPRAAMMAAAFIAAPALAADLILNEANCVGPRKWLANADNIALECAGGATGSTEEDIQFGRVLGNGGDWIELVVATDHLDLRGWQLRWAETDNTPGNADQANGTDLWFGAGNIEQGVLTFTQNPALADLRAGTILTIAELTSAQGGLDTDFSYNPCAGDWWIHINATDTALITSQVNINLNSDGCAGPATIAPGPFNVGNDSWELTIVDDNANIVLGPIGEGYGGTSGWQGSGVNSRETVRLSQNPSATPGFYEDCDQSSFSKPNRWSDTISPTVSCPRYQDYRALRSWCDCACVRIALNEYNAVGETQYLNGGTAGLDSTGGVAADGAFGRALGNGGDWFELIVTDDHVDLRGATLTWEEAADAESGVITLSNHAAWSNLRVGTIVTFIRSASANGGLDTNLSYSPWNGDRSINIWTGDANLIASTTSTVGTHGFGDFHTSNDNWRLTVRNAANQPLSITSGEGAAGYGGRGVGNTETCMLEQNASSDTRSWDNYNESIRSTFGAANSWRTCPANTVVTQNLAGIPASACTRAGDIDANGSVDTDDLLALLGSWGRCRGIPCRGDVDNNGSADTDDLLLLLGSWG